MTANVVKGGGRSCRIYKRTDFSTPILLCAVQFQTPDTRAPCSLPTVILQTPVLWGTRPRQVKDDVTAQVDKDDITAQVDQDDITAYVDQRRHYGINRSKATFWPRFINDEFTAHVDQRRHYCPGRSMTTLPPRQIKGDIKAQVNKDDITTEVDQ